MSAAKWTTTGIQKEQCIVREGEVNQADRDGSDADYRGGLISESTRL